MDVFSVLIAKTRQNQMKNKTKYLELNKKQTYHSVAAMQIRTKTMEVLWRFTVSFLALAKVRGRL